MSVEPARAFAARSHRLLVGCDAKTVVTQRLAVLVEEHVEEPAALESLDGGRASRERGLRSIETHTEPKPVLVGPT